MGGTWVFDYNNSGRKIYVPASYGYYDVYAYKSAKGWSEYKSAIVGYDFNNGEIVEAQSNNEIWYYSNYGEVVTPYNTNAFGVNIISNTYENGKGVITFNGDVTKIGNTAFKNCDSLGTLYIPDSVTEIGESAFYNCASLHSVYIPDGVTKIGYWAFYGCDFTSVTIPDSVTTIGDYAYRNCTSLRSVTIGDSVKWIGGAAFWDCTSLTSVTIPDGVMTIEGCAFYNCTSLRSVTIPSSVTEIGESAFENCSSLTSVYCKSTTPPTLRGYAFDGNGSGRKIYVPTGSVDKYKIFWDDYASAIVSYNF